MVNVAGSDTGTGRESQSVSPGGAGITRVQSAQANTGGSAVSSKAVVLGAGVSAGNLLVLSAADYGSTDTLTPPAGFTLAGVNVPQGLNGPQAAIFYAVVTAGMAGTTSFTVTLSSAHQVALTISEWHSPRGWLANPLDQAAAGNMTSPRAVRGTQVDSGTTPYTQEPSQLWMAALAYWGQGQAPYGQIGPGFAIDQDASVPGGAVSLTSLWQIAGATGSADCSYLLRAPAYWAGCIATFFDGTTVRVADSDAGSGGDGGAFAVGTRSLSSSDTGSGAEAQSVPVKQVMVASSDAGTGSDTHAGPATVRVADSDYGAGFDMAGVRVVSALAQQLAAAIHEGFSLARASVLGATGLESAQLYGAQTISLTPTVTTSDMVADDDEIGAWFNLTKADLTVTNGFMSFAVISQLNGTTVSSSGTSPADYYGLPLWTQYQHNKPSVPMAFRMAARGSGGQVRTIDFVLYKVQLSVLDFTGMVYKGGLGVSYAGTVLFSSTDEAGNNLAGPEIGRIVSYAGQRTGSIGPVPFQGL